MKAMRLILFVLILFMALPEFAAGIPALLNGVRARGDIWSVQHNYFGDAAFLLIPALCAVALAYGGAFRAKTQNWLYFATAAGLMLLMAVAIPGWLTMPQHRAEFAVRMKMSELQRAADVWAGENGAYPRTREELAAALGQAKLTGGQMSKYQRGGNLLPYETVVAQGAAAPVARLQRPATLYYAVTADGRRYWITGTALPAEVSEAVAPVSEPSGGMFVAQGELEPPAAAKPAPVKK